MNEISFVVAPTEYGVGLADGVEPVVDGISVVDLFKHADGRRTSFWWTPAAETAVDITALTSVEGRQN